MKATPEQQEALKRALGDAAEEERPAPSEDQSVAEQPAAAAPRKWDHEAALIDIFATDNPEAREILQKTFLDTPGHGLEALNIILTMCRYHAPEIFTKKRELVLRNFAAKLLAMLGFTSHPGVVLAQLRMAAPHVRQIELEKRGAEERARKAQEKADAEAPPYRYQPRES